jgi:hypothetical protein
LTIYVFKLVAITTLDGNCHHRPLHVRIVCLSTPGCNPTHVSQVSVIPVTTRGSWTGLLNHFWK